MHLSDNWRSCICWCAMSTLPPAAGSLPPIFGEAACFMILGDGEYNMARYEEALKTFAQARTLFEAAGDPTGVANSIVRMGNIYRERGDFEQAEQSYREAEDIFRENGIDSGIVNCMRALADMYKRQRKIDQAKKQYGATLQYCRETKQSQA